MERDIKLAKIAIMCVGVAVVTSSAFSILLCLILVYPELALTSVKLVALFLVMSSYLALSTMRSCIEYSTTICIDLNSYDVFPVLGSTFGYVKLPNTYKIVLVSKLFKDKYVYNRSKTYFTLTQTLLSKLAVVISIVAYYILIIH